MQLQGKHILLGVGGGIAVYRAVELMRLLMKQGAEVQVVMTKSASEFVTPLTFEALSGNKVHTDLFDLTEQHGMGHIQLVRWADMVVVAPATANLITKIARGIAEDLLTTLLLASEVPILIAPAMNVSMWQSAGNQANITLLKERDIQIIEPVSGELACGEQGIGRLAEPKHIMQAALPMVTEQNLAGQTWVINAGPTLEAWDAVRVLTNRATGTLGARLADAAAIQGAKVILIAGKGTPQSRYDVQRIDVISAADMMKMCVKYAADSHVFVGTAAVSDYRFVETSEGKLKREGSGSLQVELIENPDIIQTISHMDKRPSKVIAFAAESENHVAYAQDKLKRKAVDAIVANDVCHMGSNHASGWYVSQGDVIALDATTKEGFAANLIQHITK